MIRLLDSRSLALRIMGDSIMKEQIIITIGRESGSGGHAIAKKIADEMGIECYDKKRLVEGTAKISGMDSLTKSPSDFLFQEGSEPSRIPPRATSRERHLSISGRSQPAERAA